MSETSTTEHISGANNHPMADVDPIVEQKLERLESIADKMDRIYTIPKTNIGVGIDPLIGLIPGVGDLIAMGIAVYLVFKGVLLGAPNRVLGRMTINLIAEGIIGSIPIVGDIIDFLWAMNVQNVGYLRKNSERLSGDTNWSFLVIGLVTPVVVTVGIIFILISTLLALVP